MKTRWIRCVVSALGMLVAGCSFHTASDVHVQETTKENLDLHAQVLALTTEVEELRLVKSAPTQQGDDFVPQTRLFDETKVQVSELAKRCAELERRNESGSQLVAQLKEELAQKDQIIAYLQARPVGASPKDPVARQPHDALSPGGLKGPRHHGYAY